MGLGQPLAGCATDSPFELEPQLCKFLGQRPGQDSVGSSGLPSHSAFPLTGEAANARWPVRVQPLKPRRETAQPGGPDSPGQGLGDFTQTTETQRARWGSVSHRNGSMDVSVLSVYQGHSGGEISFLPGQCQRVPLQINGAGA